SFDHSPIDGGLWHRCRCRMTGPERGVTQRATLRTAPPFARRGSRPTGKRWHEGTYARVAERRGDVIQCDVRRAEQLARHLEAHVIQYILEGRALARQFAVERPPVHRQDL